MARTRKDTPYSEQTEFLKELTQILDKNNLTELEMQTESISVRLARASTIAPTASPPTLAQPIVPPPPASDNLPPPSAPEPSAESHHGAVKSPMVGTVYLSPEPEAPQFVNIGDVYC